MSKQNNMRSLNWRQSGWRSGGWKNSDVTVEAPADSILHWDADIDAFSEQTGGVHTFNHAVLSPQYQRNADGSYSNVGAKPAVDVFDGEKWLRSCGAITNLLPSGAEDLTTWTPVRSSVTGAEQLTPYKDTAYRVSANSELNNHKVYAQTIAPSGSYTIAVMIKKDTSRYSAVSLTNQAESVRLSVLVDFDLKKASLINGSGVYSLVEQSDGWFLLTLSGATISGDISVGIFVYVRDNNGQSAFVGTNEAVLIGSPQLTATSYPVPYVPPGVTQPASNATTTNGCWFALPDGSPLWQALTGAPLTLATRVRMGVGSGDIGGFTAGGVVAHNTSIAQLLYYQGLDGDTGTDRVAMSFDGTNYASITQAWPRNSVIRRFTQVNTAGTQFRVGYMIEGTHTTIQWSAWVNFDGSFNPSTLYSLMLGFNNAYPMWLNKITAWKKQVTDAEILEAMA